MAAIPTQSDEEFLRKIQYPDRTLAALLSAAFSVIGAVLGARWGDGLGAYWGEALGAFLGATFGWVGQMIGMGLLNHASYVRKLRHDRAQIQGLLEDTREELKRWRHHHEDEVARLRDAQPTYQPEIENLPVYPSMGISGSIEEPPAYMVRFFQIANRSKATYLRDWSVSVRLRDGTVHGGQLLTPNDLDQLQRNKVVKIETENGEVVTVATVISAPTNQPLKLQIPVVVPSIKVLDLQAKGTTVQVGFRDGDGNQWVYG